MRVGRPKSFDEREVLERAMELFWAHGYQSVGLAQLLEHMGISRQSLYDTFGNKRELFVQVIRHYRSTRLAAALELLAQTDTPPLDNVRAVVRFFERLAADASCRGCLVANALVEMAPHDAEIAGLLEESLELLRKEIQRTLELGRERGELAGSKSPVELSRALTNSLVGLAVMGKLKTDPATLRDVYSGTLSMLD